MMGLFRSEVYQIRKTLAVKMLFLFILLTSVFLGIRESGASYATEIKEAGWDYLLYGGGSLLSSMEDYSLVVLLASLLAGWMVSSAFETRTIQEAVCYGKSRTKVYLVKVVTYLITSFLMCLVVWTGGSIFIFIKNGIGTQEVVGNLCQWNYIAGMLFAGILAYLSIFVICGVIAFITQKTSITMGICIIGIAFGFNIITALLPESLLKIVNYTPAGLYRQVLKMDVSFNDIIRTSCISAAWIVAICAAGLWKFKRTELK